MAEPITRRGVALDQYQFSPTQVPTQRTYLVPPKGMDTAKRLNLLEPSTSRLVSNLAIRDGVYNTRFGTSLVGTVALTEVVYAEEFLLSDGTSYMIRWREDGVDYLDAGTWVEIPDAGLVTADAITSLAVTAWNDTLVFSTQKNKMFVLSFSPTPTIALITDSPLGSTHLTTFNNRVIASIGRKIKWCINKNNLDWTGLGSGEEELLASPGGKVDSQTAVYPITDEIAYAIRSLSVWQMSRTGNFDAPFAFSQLWSGVGGLYPLATCQIPQGIAFLSQDGVVTVDPSNGKREIGLPVRRSILPLSRAYLRRACLVYDSREDELRLSIPDGNQAAHRVYRYNRQADAWTVDTYQAIVRAMSFTRFAQSTLTIDGLTALAGTIDTLPVGTIDDLGVTDKSVGLIFALDGSSKRIIRENDTVGNDLGARDKDSAGLSQAGQWRLETGYVFGGPSIVKTHVTEIQFEYESEGAATLLVEYSDDGGVVWNQYDVLTVVSTGLRPKIARARGSLYRESMCIAISCADTPNFKLIAMHVVVDAGAQVADAS